MSIGTPTSLGSNNEALSNVSSITLTTTAAIVEGNLAGVVISYITGGTIPTVSSVSDGTNTYIKAIGVSGAASRSELWYKENATAVGSGATITATLSGSTSGSNGYGIEAFQVSGIVTSGSLDKTASDATTTATPSASSGILGSSNEIVIGTTFQGLASPQTFTESSGFSTLFNASTSGASKATSISNKIVSATSSVAYSPTWSSLPNTGQVCLLATFKGDLIIAPGNFTLTGNNATFKVAQSISSGALSLTGNNVTFQTGNAIGTGPFSLTGNAALFKAVLAAQQATFTFTGVATPMQVKFAVAQGQFVETGNAVTFLVTQAVDSGSFVFDAIDALGLNVLMAVNTGEFVIVALDATMKTTMERWTPATSSTETWTIAGMN